jgi:transposase InsO family protein
VNFLERAERFLLRSGIPRIERVMTGNGACYISRRFRRALQRRSIRHLCTHPYPPEANDKAERFIQTMLVGWAYRRAYPTSACRTAALWPWLRYYNERRPHRSLGMTPPLHALMALTQNNVCGSHSYPVALDPFWRGRLERKGTRSGDMRFLSYG